MYTSLFNTVRLLRDNHSFTLTSALANDDRYWILSHFGDLQVTKSAVWYERARGIRARMDTVYKRRKMRAQFATTIEFLAYIGERYISVSDVSFSFSNGWRFSTSSSYFMHFYTNSQQERDELLRYLLDIAGLYHVDIAKLDRCYSYFIHWHKPPQREDFPSLDEFWPEDEAAEWRRKASEHYGF